MAYRDLLDPASVVVTGVALMLLKHVVPIG
jgi:hypothetical protein